MSRLLPRTRRESPADAELISHQLLVRGGYIRRLTAGIYSFLPLGLAVLQNISTVIREELNRCGAQEVLMPALHPWEIWESSGRDRLLGEVLPSFLLEGRGGRYVLGPTHEEVATAIVAGDVDSYKQLPVCIYQIQTKFRDEARPRFGLLRTREFIMADAYSFDASREGMHHSYDSVFSAYVRIFERLELNAVPVEAASGAIGGDVNHEFMVDSDAGEDSYVKCTNCGYAANIEAATIGTVVSQEYEAPGASGMEGKTPGSPLQMQDDQSSDQVTSVDRAVGVAQHGQSNFGGSEKLAPVREHYTPGIRSIEEVVRYLNDQVPEMDIKASTVLKCIATLDPSSGEPVVLVVPGDREVRLPASLRLFDEADFDSHPELPKGYIGPVGLSEHGVKVMADNTLRNRVGPWVSGANKPDTHVSGLLQGRDFTVDLWGDIVVAREGDPCPRCGHPLLISRSAEVAHTFQLGVTYSSKMEGATFIDEMGMSHPYWMGCYGIGVSRLPAVIVEVHHDERGIVWPCSVAPYKVHLLSIGAGKDEEVVRGALGLYRVLSGVGIKVLYDDRQVSPGIQFSDADLLGMPWQLVVGNKGLARGVVELRARRSGKTVEIPFVSDDSSYSKTVEATQETISRT